MALLEAMAASVPIVATRVGGIPDVIDSSSGHLFESGDVNGIAAGLAEVLRNPDASRAMAERAQKRLNDGFAVEPWLSMYESIYRGIVRPM
jgi:glycosyltransferase involved in cell wall biosynthesis